MDDEVFFRVVRGVPTAEELAALVGVLFQRSRVVPAAEAPARSRWRESGLPAITPRPGPGVWRASALPR